MAFTMSLDDFIITHFTKGPGVDTLSTKIYAEVRKGIRPEMYALSTLLFVTVLVLLILINSSPKGSEDTKVTSSGKGRKWVIPAGSSRSPSHCLHRRRDRIQPEKRRKYLRGKTDRL